jgi:glutamate-ammonia-ligase adenylyltransferase
MPIRLQSIPFANPARAQFNWSQVGKTTPRELLTVLGTLLRSSPDPDSALNYFERFNSGAPDRITQYLLRHSAALNILIPIFSQSHFLSETLLLHPEYLEWLHRDKRIEFLKSKEDLLEELARFEATLGEMSLAERLARFKRREYLRIAFRDVTKIATRAETTYELSTLADVILEEALRLCDQQLLNRYGMPQSVDADGKTVSSQFVIIALGKLGGNELNYSSDIDLLYLYSFDGETEGIESRSETKISNQEYFIKLSNALTEAVSQMTPSGWAFRVDLRLRPQGREGFLARSLPSASDYYRRHAEPWELQALLKARPVAGELFIGKQLLHHLQAHIYPQEDKKGIVGSIEAMRKRMDTKLQQAESAAFDVKLSRGTIRDIEFITQWLQRIHGADDAWVREANTVLGLRRLHDNNYISRGDFVGLASAYEFFRIVEHRLQLDRGQQTHAIPEGEEHRRILARRMGFEDVGATSAQEAMLSAIEYHRGVVMRINQRIVDEMMGESLRPARPRVERDFGTPESHPTTEAFSEVMRHPVAKLHVELAEVLRAVAIAPSSRGKFLSFLDALASKPELLKDLKIGEDLSERLEVLFNSGPAVTEMMTRHPDWAIAMLSQSSWRNQFSRRRFQKQAVEGVRRPAAKLGLRRQGAETGDVQSMRTQIRHGAFFVLMQDLLCHPSVARTLDQLSSIAECAVSKALTLAGEQLRRRLSHSEHAILKDRKFRFGIFALGRLATHELDFGSDLDLIFVCDYSHFKLRHAAREVAFRLAETTLSILASYTREGPLYTVDLRLRPSGKEGDLVQDAMYLVEYFHGAAQSWEHAAYLKLRPVAGDLEWARGVLRSLRKESVNAAKRLQIKSDLLDIRSRLEQAANNGSSAWDIKQSAGGIYDIEFALASALLTNSSNYRTGSTIAQALQRAAREGILSADVVGVFVNAICFYRTIEHVVRMVQGRSDRRIDLQMLQLIPPHEKLRLRSSLIAWFKTVGALVEFDAETLLEVCREISASVRQKTMEVFSL